MNAPWDEQSVLAGDITRAEPREIFQAVCDELGKYFSERGAKYTRSNRKIKINFEKVCCEFVFWSSHSNTRGEWVNLEIVTSVYALDKTDLERKGLLYFDIRPENFNVYGIDSRLFGEIAEYISKTSELVKTFDTAEGISGFCGEEKFVNEHPNNAVYWKRL